LVVDQPVLVAKVGVDDPCLHCTGLHEMINFAEDSHPVLLRGLLSICFEAKGVVGISHALMLQIRVQKICSIHIFVML
jgi:hypothetical protein